MNRIAVHNIQFGVFLKTLSDLVEGPWEIIIVGIEPRHNVAGDSVFSFSYGSGLAFVRGGDQKSDDVRVSLDDLVETIRRTSIHDSKIEWNRLVFKTFKGRREETTLIKVWNDYGKG